MSRFKVTDAVGGGGGGDAGNENQTKATGGIDNPAMDPVELNVYGLYAKRNSITCPAINGGSELKRKSSYGFTHLTR